MVKKTFMYLIIIALVGVTAWFFIQKSRNASKVEEGGLAGLVASQEPTPSSTPDNKGNNWTKLPSGLQIQDVSVGYGKEAREGDVISAHYSGTLANGTKFDNSYDRGEPFSFILGSGMVIKGWDLGIVGMKVGGKRKLIIPAELGYGDRGAGGIIPPGATLYFDVELIAAETPTRK